MEKYKDLHPWNLSKIEIFLKLVFCPELIFNPSFQVFVYFLPELLKSSKLQNIWLRPLKQQIIKW